MKKNKLSLLAFSIALFPFISSAQTIVFGDADKGTLSIGGNVEFNINFRDHETPRDADSESQNEIDQDGRLLLEFAGEKSLTNGYFVGFKGQPLLNTSGSVTVDDAYVEFGQKSNWGVKVGRFEGFDMFPKTQDVFLEYSGDTSNSLYVDGSSYSYQLAEARGRGSDGQILLNKHLGNLYLELNMLLGDRTSLFTQGEYHGVAIDASKSKDTVVARPVISYQLNNFNFALAAETNLISDAVVDTNGNDVSERNGYGAKITWQNDDFVINGMYNYMDAFNETNQTFGLTGGWRDTIGLGYIHSMNEYDNQAWRVGDINVSTFYASYAFRNAMNIKNFSILLGAYYSDLENDLSLEAMEPMAENGDAGARIRLHYVF